MDDRDEAWDRWRRARTPGEAQVASLALWKALLIHYWWLLLPLCVWVVYAFSAPQVWIERVYGGILLTWAAIVCVLGFSQLFDRTKAKRKAQADAWFAARGAMAQAITEAQGDLDKVRAILITQDMAFVESLGGEIRQHLAAPRLDGSHEDLP